MSPESYVVAHPFRHGGKRYAEGDSCAGVASASLKALLRSGWIRPIVETVSIGQFDTQDPDTQDPESPPFVPKEVADLEKRSFFRRARKPATDDASDCDAEE